MFEQGISIIFPAFNEEKNIEEVVTDALKYLKTLKDEWEVVIVNDGSGDKTGEIADKLSLKNDRIKVIHHSVNQGKGVSLRDGFKESRYNFVFFTDSDRQFRLKALDTMWPLAKTGVVDLIIGYRVNRQDRLVRKLLSRGYNILADQLFSLDVKDIDCAFKIFRKDIFKKINIEQPHFFVDTEILAKARFFNFRILEVGVSHFPRKAGKSSVRFKFIPLAFRELWRIRTSIERLKK